MRRKRERLSAGLNGDELAVCIAHGRFVPCRKNWSSPHIYSTCPDDIVRVRAYQRSETDTWRERPVVTLDELFDVEDLTAAIDGGYVTMRRHPTLPLTIYNYTAKAQYGHVWTPVTRQCRGLIVHQETWEVIARPFEKFFNHNEPTIPLNPDMACDVLDKVDGSLGIIYPTPDGPAVATRGSFTSRQAIRATEILHNRYGGWEPPVGMTVLVEIVYPANRIVVDYGDLDDLVYLGIVDTATGQSLSANVVGWPGPVVEVLPYRSLSEALAASPRPGREGMVVHFVDDTRVKIKQADYVALHRILTRLSARRLWQYCAVNEVVSHLCGPRGDWAKHAARWLHMDVNDVYAIVDSGPNWLDHIRATLPLEAVGWMLRTVARLHSDVAVTEAAVRSEADRLRHLPRKSAAALLANNPHRGMIFALLDEKPITVQLWASVRPVHETPYLTEDTESE